MTHVKFLCLLIYLHCDDTLAEGSLDWEASRAGAVFHSCISCRGQRPVLWEWECPISNEWLVTATSPSGAFPENLHPEVAPLSFPFKFTQPPNAAY